jgi:Zn-dependent peptidase ImmA (M78 family)
MMVATKTWSEPLVLGLMDEAGTTDPREAIEAYAEKLRLEAEQVQLPVDVEMIASVKGVRARRGSHEFAGRIFVETDGQLVMDLNIEDSPARQRFTCAHEMMHTAFPDFTEEKRYRLDATVEAKPLNQEEEYLCDLGAAALLMPASLLGSYSLADEGLSAIERLAGEAQVSLEAAGNRLAELSPVPVAFMVFEYGHKPADRPALRRGEAVAKQVRLRYAHCSMLDFYIPRFKGADPVGTIAQAHASGKREHGREGLPGAGDAGMFEIEASCYGVDQRQRVLAVAVPA